MKSRKGYASYYIFLPQEDKVVFPNSILSIKIPYEEIRLVLKGEGQKFPFVIGTFIPGKRKEPPYTIGKDIYEYGTIVKVISDSPFEEKGKPKGYLKMVRGLKRVKLLEIIFESVMYVKCETLTDLVYDDLETEVLAKTVKELGIELLEMNPYVPDDLIYLIDGITDPVVISDMISSYLDIPIEDKIDLLRTLDLKERLKKVIKYLYVQKDLIALQQKIDRTVKERINRTQKEFLLRQQLKLIQEELGELEDPKSEIEELITRIEQAQLPEEVKKVALKHASKLKQMTIHNPDYTVNRVYVEWLLELPWNRSSEDNLELERVKEVLEEDHWGLEKVKERIIGYLSVRKLKKNTKTPILCFVGPPGVGKTSLGRSIARAMGRRFVRISLGGVYDEAAIRGHRRTYVGALPGRIIQGIKRAGTNNPVFMIDEIDKIGRDFRGDPAAALLEVLDPEQNYSFSDHYIEIPFDLSNVLFITTANTLDPIPLPLKDRMEVIEIPGYTRYEKLQIAKYHLIPKQLKEHGFKGEEVHLLDEAIFKIIDSYTKEAGVRNLERNIATICRGIGLKISEGKHSQKEFPIIIDKNSVEEYLGPEIYLSELIERTEVPGVAISLIWTPYGGEVVFIESTKMKGDGKLILTGSLGAIFKESATTALSCIRSYASSLKVETDFLQKYDIHVHVPYGALPKDGASSGLPIFASVLSLLRNERLPSDTAMSGEITLKGKILPVRGIKEKVLAAHRAGVKRIIFPQGNEAQLVEIPEEIKREVKILLVEDINQVVSTLFETK